MVDKKLATDYCNYFIQNDISKELKPINLTIDEMITRLEEFESLFRIISAETSQMFDHILPKVMELSKGFHNLCKRVDFLEYFVKVVENDLVVLEKQIETADNELDIPEKPMEILFKSLNIFSKPNNHTNLKEDGQYHRPKIFDTNDYFEKKHDD